MIQTYCVALVPVGWGTLFNDKLYPQTTEWRVPWRINRSPEHPSNRREWVRPLRYLFSVALHEAGIIATIVYEDGDI